MIYLTEHMNKMSFISMSMPIATTDFASIKKYRYSFISTAVN